MSKTTQTTCPHCGSEKIKMGHQNKKICRTCSFVIDRYEIIDRNHKSSDHSMPDEHEQSLSTDWVERMSPRDSSEQFLIEVISEMESIILELGGSESDCVKGAEILTDAWQQGFFRGRSTAVGIGATVYVTFRLNKPRPLSIVANICEISTSELRSGYCSFRAEYGISGEIVNPTAYLAFLSSELSLNQSVQEQAESLIESSTEVTGSPTGIAVAGLYLAAQSFGESVTLAEAGSAAGVTKETVWRKTQEMAPTVHSDEQMK